MATSFFPELPMPEGPNITATEIEDWGEGHYVTTHSGVTKDDYNNYLVVLDELEYKKFADNGEGLGGTVFNATYTKGKWAVTVIYMAKREMMSVSVCFDKPLSERLIYKDEYVKDNIPGAKTKLHMLELWWLGNSFVLQLKNGHFIISDGGTKEDAKYLMDYLYSLTPEGEKPVIEAWLISHGHSDHCGVIAELLNLPSDTFYLEGIYFNASGETMLKKEQYSRMDAAWMHFVTKVFKKQDGTSAEFYRPQTGQRLYFSDISIDVVHAQEQLILEEATADINDCSTWFMLNIEGQKVLLTGDGENGCQKTIMANYNRDYLDLDMMTLMHHGFNTHDYFTDYCKLKTLLVTAKDVTPVRQANENNYLKSKVEEHFSWGDGAKVMTFPYTVGSYETLPKNQWIYHDRYTRREQWNIYRYWKGHHKKEIQSLRINGVGTTLAPAVLTQKINEHLPLPFTDDGTLINLVIDKSVDSDKKYKIEFNYHREAPIRGVSDCGMYGFIIRAIDEETLYEAIDVFVNTADWSDRGFTAKLVE